MLSVVPIIIASAVGVITFVGFLIDRWRRVSDAPACNLNCFSQNINHNE